MTSDQVERVADLTDWCVVSLEFQFPTGRHVVGSLTSANPKQPTGTRRKVLSAGSGAKENTANCPRAARLVIVSVPL